MKDPGAAQLENSVTGATDLPGMSKANLHNGTTEVKEMNQESIQAGAMENTVVMMDHIVTTATTVGVTRQESKSVTIGIAMISMTILKMNQFIQKQKCLLEKQVNGMSNRKSKPKTNRCQIPPTQKELHLS